MKDDILLLLPIPAVFTVLFLCSWRHERLQLLKASQSLWVYKASSIKLLRAQSITQAQLILLSSHLKWTSISLIPLISDLVTTHACRAQNGLFCMEFVKKKINKSNENQDMFALLMWILLDYSWEQKAFGG